MAGNMSFLLTLELLSGTYWVPGWPPSPQIHPWDPPKAVDYLLVVMMMVMMMVMVMMMMTPASR